MTKHIRCITEIKVNIFITIYIPNSVVLGMSNIEGIFKMPVVVMPLSYDTI